MHKENSTKVAVKIINKELLQGKANLLRKVEKEIAILKLFDHKNILKLYDVFRTKNDLYLFVFLS